MKSKDSCEEIRRKLSCYLDDEIAAEEKDSVEAHLETCAQCAAEKEDLQKLTTIFRQIPDIIPAGNSEELFWEKVHQTDKQKVIERIRAFITQWDFVPVYYSATALLFLGIAVGIGFSTVYDSISYRGRLNPLAVEYLALNRMDTISYGSFAGVYSGGINPEQNETEGAQ